MATTTPFQYTPLLSPDSIRLLILSPSPSPTAPLRGSLLPTTIRARSADLHTGYIALSYVWGDPTRTNTIFLSNAPNDPANPAPTEEGTLGITASLFSALLTLRHATLPTAVWADAVCIDQANIRERNAQVGLMGQIYALADHTVIDLGPGEAAEEEEEAVGRVLVRAAEGTAGGDGNDEEGVRRLLARRWFTRAWVLQELVMSRDPVMQCAAARARWAEVCNAVLSRPAGGGLMKGMDQTRRRFYGSGGMGLLELLVTRRGAAATDERDLVYAVLGMLTAEVAVPGGFVDYGMGVREVYTKTARYVVETGREARGSTDWPTLGGLLAAAEDGGPSDNRPWGLPSWVPNWSMPKDLTPLPLAYMGGGWVWADAWMSRYDSNPLLRDVRRWCAVVSSPPILVCLGHNPSMTVEVIDPLFPPPLTMPPGLLERCQAILRGTGSALSSSAERRKLLRDVLLHLCDSLSTLQEQPSPQGRQQGAELDRKWATTLDNWSYIPPDQQTTTIVDPLVDAIYDYLKCQSTASPLQGRRLALLRQRNPSHVSNTSRLLIGVVTPHAQPGDICVALLPSLSLYVVREEPDPAPAWEQSVLQKAEAIKAYERVGHSGLPTSQRGWKPSKPMSVGT